MDPQTLELAAWSYGLAALAYGGFAVQLGLGWRRGRRGLLMLAAVALSAVWAALALSFALVPNAWTWAAASTADTLRVGAWLALMLSIVVPEPTAAGGPRWRLPRSALGALLVAAVAIQGTSALFPAGSPGPGRYTLFVSLALAVAGLVTVEQVLRNIPEHARWALKPLCLGLGGLFAFDLFVFAEGSLFRQLDADLWTARGIVAIVVIPFLALSAVRNRDWRIDIHLSRQVVFRSSALLISGAYLLTIAAAGYYVRFFGGSWGRALQAAFLFAALLFLVGLAVSGTLRSRLRVFISKNFFSYRYDYREEWLRFTQALSEQDPSLGIRELSIKALADLVESPGGALWLVSDSGAFVQAARWNMGRSDVSEPANGALGDFLRRTGWVVSLDEYRTLPARYEGVELPQWLLEIPGAWIVVPLSTGADLIGFVVLARSRASIDLNWEVNDLLKTAGRQAATFLGQVRAAEALLEARKFESFNRLSAFVVHDIKNQVAQLSLLLKNAQRHRDNPEFQQDMLMTVENVAERMRNLLLQLRAGVTPIDPPHPVDLHSIAQRIRKAKQSQAPSLAVDGPEGIHALGHEERLERVIGHLVQNAIDATAADGRVWIRIGHEGAKALIEVGDTGHGMTAEFVRDRLFKPFQTTKSAGMGVGAFESQQYVKELGGSIDVESQPNAGTRVTVWLPLARGGSSSRSEDKAVA